MVLLKLQSYSFLEWRKGKTELDVWGWVHGNRNVKELFLISYIWFNSSSFG